ncbi:FHA domain-containing protein [Desulfolutivibrio sulfoxidireducens]|uniref:FHA domain-containing protein n=1 Tax=Desulfolutivibrio sulfoxidireducens TaxID=2773299 RepID=UPI00159E5A54|nr:FHA domain-containing protein [Desulfolutivibrio sulfoxidireducens]QLA14667.1 FHA domain-containing protein [Desulfolutivibrio sulfoxidireducens]QLA18248.1 FHA domain-containing protein [Desulfolutivibrio sulfoxidireducens]
MIVLSAFRDGRPVGHVQAEEGRVVSIGRATTNDLVLESQTVSREHCRIVHDGTGWSVVDAGGKAGVSVGGQRVSGSRPLADGDTVEVEDFRITVGISAPEASAADAPDRTRFRPRPTFVGEGPNAVEVMEGPGQGTIRRFEARVMIGRSARCDLVLDDPTVSREHLLIEFRDGRFKAVNQNPNNATLKNGAPIQSAVVATGDILTIGPARLRLALSGSGGTAAGQGLLARLLGDKKLLVVAGVVLFLVIAALFFLGGPEKTPHEAVVAGERTKERAIEDAEYMRKVMTLLIQARRLADEGQDEQAMARLTALLEIDSGNEEAKELAASLRTRIDARAAEARQREAQAQAAREKALPLLQNARDLLAAGDVPGARQALEQAQATGADLPEAREVLSGIEAREEAARREAEERKRAETEERAHLVALYDEAEAALAADAPYRALVAYRRLAEEETDPGRAAVVRKKAAEIQDALVKRVMPDFTLGQRLYAQKKYGEAFKVWAKVLAIYPDAKETKARVAELAPMLEAEAKRLYEEGLVYDGLGDRDTAKARWRAVLETMPLQENEYYRKASAKLSLSQGAGGAP